MTKFFCAFLTTLSLQLTAADTTTNYSILYDLFMNQASPVEPNELQDGHRHMECFNLNSNIDFTKVFWVKKNGGGILPSRTFLSFESYDITSDFVKIEPNWGSISEAQTQPTYKYLYSTQMGGVVAIKKYNDSFIVWLSGAQALCTLPIESSGGYENALKAPEEPPSLIPRIPVVPVPFP